eukprot:Gregarina_sp_Pseudo_9__1150@NODE_1758_length_1350_cov_42_540046_g1630_i0_p3_GENE_NODE_1758_length_1350_cov_42_540046_g1630_i0NODE_1758_length_1350_cov_42_540046_g1630_i0_p3_ORF_typecomplete_len139_score27_29Vanabin2/PF11437_8/81Vanabin2/PF11437_8/1_4_NODE_1758_length_1350_cov_42_540046_g1630_i0386802
MRCSALLFGMAAASSCVEDMSSFAAPGCAKLCGAQASSCQYTNDPQLCIALATLGRCLTPRSAAAYWCLQDVKAMTEEQQRQCHNLCLQYARHYPISHIECIGIPFTQLHQCVTAHNPVCWTTLPQKQRAIQTLYKAT